MERALLRRQELLEALVDAPGTKPELVDRIAVSRSTVDRGIADLLERDCVEKVDSRFQLTETGRLALEARLEFRTIIDQIQDATPLLDVAGLDSVSLDLLRGATINVADPRHPWKVLDRSDEIVNAANAMYGTGPAVFPRFFDDISQSVENQGLFCELVLDDAVFDSLDASRIQMLRELVKADNGSLFLTDLDDSFAVWIFDLPDEEYAGITVYGSAGIEGIIYNDTPNAVSWARKEYRERKEAAELLWDFQ
ncbi:helix-turn-helix transcriptional regulator [Halostagnicola bangensis]